MKTKPMTVAQLKAILKDLGMSQSEAARELDISDRQMRRYVAGEIEVPMTVKLSLYYLNEIYSVKRSPIAQDI